MQRIPLPTRLGCAQAVAVDLQGPLPTPHFSGLGAPRNVRGPQALRAIVTQTEKRRLRQTLSHTVSLMKLPLPCQYPGVMWLILSPCQ